MGGQASKYLMPHLWREDEPNRNDDIKYHPEFGFDEPRRPKGPRATEMEMDSGNLPADQRDECAHLLMVFRGCIRYHAPCEWRCTGYKKELDHCRWEERIHDMKEFEREKRLNARERRIAQAS